MFQPLPRKAGVFFFVSAEAVWACCFGIPLVKASVWPVEARIDLEGYSGTFSV